MCDLSLNYILVSLLLHKMTVHYIITNMIEGLFILAIGAIILLWVDRKSMKEIINRQEYQIRHITRRFNDDDKHEMKQLRDDYHYEKIIRQIMLEDEYAYLTPDDIVYENANNRFFEIYGYKYVGNVEINKNITLNVDIYTDLFDKYIKDFFPSSKGAAIDKIVQKFMIAKLEAVILFERWQKFHLIDYHPYEEWIPNSPKETLTIEQFKERMSVASINVMKDESTGEVYFKAGNIKGEVCIKGIPKRPMLSLFITSDSETHWLLHEEGTICASPTLIDF